MEPSNYKIQHFYSRAGFGIPSEYYFDNRSLKEHINIQFRSANEIKLFSVKKMKGSRKLSKEERDLLRKESRIQAKRWLDSMIRSRETSLAEKMGLFWHGKLACRVILGQKIASEYINAIRKNALGNYKTLLMDVSKTAAMIRYLNNQQNKKSSPNENFAREVLELFTIGRANYTETDIKEAARAFTGWSSNLTGDFVFRKEQHDGGVKTFMGKTGYFSGEDIIDIILEQKETAVSLTQKIYHYFVSDQLPKDRLIQLSEQFYSSNYDIADLMRTIFESDWFYDTENIGSQIKSPIHLLVNYCQLTNSNINNGFTAGRYSKRLGQKLLDPPNVAGWPGGKSWIDNASLAIRMNLGIMLLDKKINKKIDIQSDTQQIYELVSKQSKDPSSDLSFLILNNNVSERFAGFPMTKLRNKKDFDTLIAAYTSQLEFQMC